MLKKNLKNKTMAILAALSIAGMLTSCAATPAEQAAMPAKESGSAVAVENPITVEEKENVVDTESPVDVEENTAAEESPVIEDPVEPAEESSAHAETSEANGYDVDPIRYLHDPAYSDEMLAVNELGPRLAGLQSKPETSSRYCTVDMREDHESYDVDWDYGSVYDSYVDTADWSKVFDADYYMAAFPMLALQYHYDEDQLLRHFQTVGIHEGRQGSESFNVGAYMDWCSENLPYTTDAFQGDYALYYLFYALAWDEQPDSFPSDGHPMQYQAIMTFSQKQELDGINAYREKAGVDLLVFDPELGALANFRAWTNQDEELIGHDWIHDSKNQNTLNMLFTKLSTDEISENAIETSATSQIKAWYKSYATSQLHYDAMVDGAYWYCGTSNLYVDSVAYSSKPERGTQFDLFVPDLSTAVNP